MMYWAYSRLVPVVLFLVIVGCGSDDPLGGNPDAGKDSYVGGSAGDGVGGMHDQDSSGQQTGGDRSEGGTFQGGNGGSGGHESLSSNGLLLKGTIVTPATVFDGHILVKADAIACVKPGNECAEDAMAKDATRIDTNGIIAPGLIDTHNHILFDIFGDEHWLPTIPKTCSSVDDCAVSSYCKAGGCNCVNNKCKYKNHNQWPKEREYGVMMDYKQCLVSDSQGKPVWCPQSLAGNKGITCEINKYGELKGLIAGTTAIVGLPGSGMPCFASLSRSIDVKQNGLGTDKVQTSAIFPPSATSATQVCNNFTTNKTDAYLIHCGEAVDDTAQREFEQLATVTEPDECLYAPQTSITHGTGFANPQYTKMADTGMNLIWSPASNVALYGLTNNLALARKAGLTIALAPDWSMGGSRNMLEEMKFAQTWDDEHYGDILSAKDIVHMATINAAAVLGLAHTLGRLEPGFKADLIVIDGDSSKPYDAIIDAWPSTVSLVMVGGRVLYGDKKWKDVQASAAECESLDVCGKDKFMCVAQSSSKYKLNQTFAEIEEVINSRLLELDNIKPLDAANCNPSCKQTEQCFKRTSVPLADPSNCSPACQAGTKCYRKAKSGTNQFACMTENACSDMRHRGFHPATPLFACPK